PGNAGRFTEIRVVWRQSAGLGGQKLAVRARLEAAAVEEIPLVERAEEAGLPLRVDELVERVEQRRRVAADRPDDRLRRPDGRLDDEIRELARPQRREILRSDGVADRPLRGPLDQTVARLVDLDDLHVLRQLVVE